MRSRGMLLVPCLALGALLVAATARSPIAAFDRIQHGAWQMRTLNGTQPPRRLCISDPYDLIQLRHPGASCSRFVLANEAETATVHYTCTGSGYGRTTITVETGQLIKLESQGLLNAAPFQLLLEGRRVGDCGAEKPSR